MEALIEAILRLLTSLTIPEERPDLPAAGNRLPPWTKATKTALARACQETFGAQNICIRMHEKDLEPGYENLFGGTEFLYDVTCLELGRGGRFESVHMVAESEFKDGEEVFKDFRKLLLAGSGLRVMVHDRLDDPKRPVHFEELEEEVMQFQGNCPGTTFLIAAFHNGVVEHHRIDV